MPCTGGVSPPSFAKPGLWSPPHSGDYRRGEKRPQGCPRAQLNHPLTSVSGQGSSTQEGKAGPGEEEPGVGPGEEGEAQAPGQVSTGWGWAGGEHCCRLVLIIFAINS